MYYKFSRDESTNSTSPRTNFHRSGNTRSDVFCYKRLNFSEIYSLFQSTLKSFLFRNPSFLTPLPLLGALGTEPLLVLGRRLDHTHTMEVVPLIATVAPHHVRCALHIGHRTRRTHPHVALVAPARARLLWLFRLGHVPLPCRLLRRFLVDRCCVLCHGEVRCSFRLLKCTKCGWIGRVGVILRRTSCGLQQQNFSDICAT